MKAKQWFNLAANCDFFYSLTTINMKTTDIHWHNFQAILKMLKR